jgi:hypothetical protein
VEEGEEDEDPEVDATRGSTRVAYYKYRRSYSQTGTISRGGSRETVGLFVTANRYE